MHSKFVPTNFLVLVQDLYYPILKSEERRCCRVFRVLEISWVNFLIPENGLREQFSLTFCVEAPELNHERFPKHTAE